MKTEEQTLQEVALLEPTLTRNDELSERIYAAIQGLFLPKRRWNEDAKEYTYYPSAWWELREFIFDTDLFDNYWTNADFRKGISILNDIVLVLDSNADIPDQASILKRMDYHGFGHRLFQSRNRDDEQFLHRGTHALIAATELIRKNQDHPRIQKPANDSELVDILVTLKSVYALQTMWLEAGW